MPYSIIAYRCYKQLQLDDTSNGDYPDEITKSVIEKGRTQQVLQTYTLLSLFNHNKQNHKSVLAPELWQKTTTYLPGSWIRSDDTIRINQEPVEITENNIIGNCCSIC